MPAVQRGQVVRRGKRRYGVRWYDEQGARRFQGGFETQSAAREWVDRKVEEVAALRRGDRPSPTDVPTVSTLVGRFWPPTRLTRRPRKRWASS
jgi:hypothetical protein